MSLINRSIQIQWQAPERSIVTSLSASGGSVLEEDLVIAPAASAAETDLTIITASLQAFLLVADAAMTVDFKSGTGGSGTDRGSFTLVANVPQFWVAGNGANPLSGEVGQMLVTSTPGGNLKVRALMT